jgi:ribosomal-protein-alanine N-acetyltransferase
MHPPELRTDRLKLSRFACSDAADVFAYARNPKVAETVTWDAHQTVDDSLAFINFVTGKPALDGEKRFFAWALRDPGKSDAAIGSISFSQWNCIAGQIDYALSADYWGKDLMTEAAAAVIKFAFDEFPKLIRIQATCLENNIGSRRVMEKIGMRFEGIARAGMLVKSRPVDVATYAILRSDLPN